MSKKESRQFHISVEGINCEKLHFEHLAKLINESGVVPQIKRNSILHIIRDCFCDVSMNNSRLFDADKPTPSQIK